jgi:hypothetical protein
MIFRGFSQVSRIGNAEVLLFKLIPVALGQGNKSLSLNLFGDCGGSGEQIQGIFVDSPRRFFRGD